MSDTVELELMDIKQGHNSPAMTLRYLSTLTQEDALRVQQEVEFGE